MKIVFLDTLSLGGDADLSPIASLGDFLAYGDTLPEDVVERAAGAEAVIANKVRLLREEIDALPALRLICIAATGMNNVDVEYARSHGIEVKNVAGYATGSVAEATFAMVLALLRNVVYYDRYVKSGTYAASGQWFHLGMPVGEIGRRRWGIIGLGAIGHRVAEIARMFGGEVAYHSTSGANLSAPYPHRTLEQLLRESDIVSIHAPLNDATHALIGARELAWMKPTALLVNAGRGKIVDEAALAAALDAGKLAGAGLDVFAREPLEADSPLLKISCPDRLVLAPHSAWSSAEARCTLIAAIADNIRSIFVK
ncbi:MAG: hydroxyacid dehydrogenase [Rikenellaceae bacterium]|jgi:glycerate dehydrogenase|nr:hydroxyacid dehydrogenase [Rikenellaceae bacterium]